jgi:hypothetical protein
MRGDGGAMSSKIAPAMQWTAEAVAGTSFPQSALAGPFTPR